MLYGRNVNSGGEEELESVSNSKYLILPHQFIAGRFWSVVTQKTARHVGDYAPNSYHYPWGHTTDIVTVISPSCKCKALS